MAVGNQRVDTPQTAAAILYESNGNFSRDSEAIVISGQNLPANAAVGKITASGKYTALAPAAADGSEVAAGMLVSAVDASAADAPGTVVVQHATLVNQEINWNTMTGPQITAARAELAAINIKVVDGQ